MMNVFTIFSGYMANPRHLQLDKKLEEVNEKRQDGDYDYLEEEEVATVTGEFKPINHPTEPLEDDQPMKHPLPFSSVVNEEGELTKTFIENLHKMAESAKENEVGVSRQTSKHVDRRRRDYVRHQPLPSSNHNFFQVFQQCKDFRA